MYSSLSMSFYFKTLKFSRLIHWFRWDYWNFIIISMLFIIFHFKPNKSHTKLLAHLKRFTAHALIIFFFYIVLSFSYYKSKRVCYFCVRFVLEWKIANKIQHKILYETRRNHFSAQSHAHIHRSFSCIYISIGTRSKLKRSSNTVNLKYKQKFNTHTHTFHFFLLWKPHSIY